jgi:hypothetical protein
VQQRLRTIEGHVRGIYRMVEQDSYCIDVSDANEMPCQKALDQVRAYGNGSTLAWVGVTTAIRSDDAVERERVHW